MFATSSARLMFAGIGNFKALWICSRHVMKTYVNLPPKLNICFHEGTCVRFLSKSSPNLSSSDTGDDNIEKEESKYLFQKHSRKENIARIMECTGGSESVAVAILRDYPRLKYVSSGEISRIIKFLNEKGVHTETILANYWLLTDTTDSLKEKVTLLAEMGINNNDVAVPLLRIPIERLRKTSSWCQSEGVDDKRKLTYFCEKLKCDPADIALAVSIHKFLLTVPFERMAQSLDILLGEGVPPARILKDMWVFRYRVEQVQRRVQHAREGGIEQFKTWMVRCTEKILNTTIRLQAEKRALFGPHKNSMVDYLSLRLNLSRGEAQVVLNRQPQLNRMGAAKLCNTLDFLLGKEGDQEMSPRFDPVQVWSSSRILCHSLETMKARHARLRALGYEPRNPIILYKARRKFEEHIQRLEKQALEKPDEMKILDPDVRKANESNETKVNR